MEINAWLQVSIDVILLVIFLQQKNATKQEMLCVYFC